jgi:hypothetical protein
MTGKSQVEAGPFCAGSVHVVIDNFVEVGVPVRFRSDNGPQFDAGVFRAAMNRWGVAVSNLTPNYSQSNGHAEAAVKAVKELVEKNFPFRGPGHGEV